MNNKVLIAAIPKSGNNMMQKACKKNWMQRKKEALLQLLFG